MSFNLKLAIVAFLAVQSAVCYFSIPLQQHEIKGANGVTEDWVYYFQGTYGELQYHVNTIVDTTTQFNWVSSAECSNCPAAPEGSDSYQCKDPTCVKSETKFSKNPFVAGKRIQFSGNTEATERLQVAGQTFEHLAVILPGSLAKNSSEELLHQGLRAGLGLGPKKYQVNEGALPLPKEEKDQKKAAVNQNFADEVYWSELSSKNGFSFVFSENVHQVIIGERENFFGNGEARVFQISESETSWALPLKEIQLNDVSKVPLSTAQRVRFDSTTRYIVGNAAVIKEITDAIVEFGESCTKSKEKGIYQCYCNGASDRNKFPSLNFKFGGQSDEESFFSIKNENYIDFDASSQTCNLLLKEKTNFGADDNIIELGTIFLASYYTYFNQAARTISLAPATGVNAEGLFQDSLTRILIIVFGILLAILAVLALLLILKGVRVPEKPPVVQRTFSPVKVQYVQNFQPVQTVITPIQSQYVQQQNISQQPSGLIHFSTLPQHQHYVQQQQTFVQSQQVYKTGNNQL